jgi:hypothetical protein
MVILLLYISWKYSGLTKSFNNNRRYNNLGYSINDIIEFVENETGAKNVKPEDDIFEDLGCVGDDFHELIDKYAAKFNVEMYRYLWYFHTDEEGWNIGGLFFKPPYKRVERMPITPNTLLSFANSGKWEMHYPSHHLPKFRLDILINRICVVCFIMYIFYTCS